MRAGSPGSPSPGRRGAGAGETRVHRLAVGVYDDDPMTGKLVRVHREELDVSGSVTDVPALQGVSRGKLILVNDDDLTYCSLRLDADSLRTALRRIADIAEPLPRTLVWSAAWEMTRDAELKARDFVALVMSGVQAETEVRGGPAPDAAGADRPELLRRAGLGQANGWPAFADRLLDLARESAPGSDHQLAFVNALCISVLSRQPRRRARDAAGQRSRGGNLQGLVIDADLRWRIVIALATSGDIDADGLATPFIDAEAQRTRPRRAKAARRGVAAASAGRR